MRAKNEMCGLKIKCVSKKYNVFVRFFTKNVIIQSKRKKKLKLKIKAQKKKKEIQKREKKK